MEVKYGEERKNILRKEEGWEELFSDTRPLETFSAIGQSRNSTSSWPAFLHGHISHCYLCHNYRLSPSDLKHLQESG